MNIKEIAELKRRLNPEKRNGTMIRGCYVRYDGTLISSFKESIGMLSEEELTQYCSLFKKVLSNAVNQHFLPVDFSAEDVQKGEKHGILMDVLSTELTDDDAAQTLFERFSAYVSNLPEAKTQSIADQQLLPNYLFLLLHDVWDVPGRNLNEEIDLERSTNVFRYLLACVCPVKQGKTALTYSTTDGEFHARIADWTVAAPRNGFLFPAYEDGGANLYRAMYYTADINGTGDAFVDEVFGVEPQMSANAQRETFQTILAETLEESCTLENVQAVHETIREMLDENKAAKTEEPLTLTAAQAGQVLENCGISPEKVENFENKYRETFGDYAQMPAANLLQTKQMTVNVPNISIRVAPEHSNMIQTRWIEGRAYLTIPVEGDIEVNGLRVQETPYLRTEEEADV